LGSKRLEPEKRPYQWDVHSSSVVEIELGRDHSVNLNVRVHDVNILIVVGAGVLHRELRLVAAHIVSGLCDEPNRREALRVQVILRRMREIEVYFQYVAYARGPGIALAHVGRAGLFQAPF
jgi:hypothetical protein